MSPAFQSSAIKPGHMTSLVSVLSLLVSGFETQRSQEHKPKNIQKRSGIWKVRSEVIFFLLWHGFSVMVSDVDAMWLKDPIPELLRTPADIVSSHAPGSPPTVREERKYVCMNACLLVQMQKLSLRRCINEEEEEEEEETNKQKTKRKQLCPRPVNRTPTLLFLFSTQIRKLWGSCIVMGFIFFRARPATIALLAALLVGGQNVASFVLISLCSSITHHHHPHPLVFLSACLPVRSPPLPQGHLEANRDDQIWLNTELTVAPWLGFKQGACGADGELIRRCPFPEHQCLWPSTISPTEDRTIIGYSNTTGLLAVLLFPSSFCFCLSLFPG